MRTVKTKCRKRQNETCERASNVTSCYPCHRQNGWAANKSSWWQFNWLRLYPYWPQNIAVAVISSQHRTTASFWLRGKSCWQGRHFVFMTQHSARPSLTTWCIVSQITTNCTAGALLWRQVENENIQLLCLGGGENLFQNYNQFRCLFHNLLIYILLI